LFLGDTSVCEKIASACLNRFSTDFLQKMYNDVVTAISSVVCKTTGTQGWLESTISDVYGKMTSVQRVHIYTYTTRNTLPKDISVLTDHVDHSVLSFLKVIDSRILF